MMHCSHEISGVSSSMAVHSIEKGLGPFNYNGEGGRKHGRCNCSGGLRNNYRQGSDGGKKQLGQRRNMEKLWREFFSDPSQWWDNRSEKGNARYPDFKHKKTQEGLWLDGKSNPPWVEVEMDAMPRGSLESNNFSWNQRLAAYLKAGQYDKTMELFQQMQQEGVNQDTFTFVSVLNACATLQDLEEGKRIHAQTIRSGCEFDVFVGNSLIDMYAKCKSVEDAWKVFKKMPRRDVVSWNSMLMGYVRCGQGQKALELYGQMQGEQVEPVRATFIALLNACANAGALQEGRHVHKQIIERCYEADVVVSNCLVDMYAKCGSIEDAWRVFEKIPVLDVVAWSAMILGYVKCGQWQKALALFHKMQKEGVEPNAITFVGILNACAGLAALEEGRCVHEQIIQTGCDSDVFVGNSLIDMYAKCGSIKDAWKVFDKMPTHDVVSWTALLKGYAMHGYANDAIFHFEQMRQAGVKLDGITYVSLLSACSHAGLVDEGLNYFESMGVVDGISATMEHHTCMVDLLGRAGHLEVAEDFIKTIPSQPTASVWLSLLSACRVHGNVQMAERIAKLVLKSDPVSAGGYVLLSNVYAAAGKWNSSASIHRQRLEKGVKKQPEMT